MSEMQNSSAVYLLRDSDGTLLPMTVTRDGGSTFSQSTDSETSSITEQPGFEGVKISNLTRTHTVDALLVDKNLLSMALGDATVQSGAVFNGKAGGITPKYFEMFVIYNTPLPNGKYLARYFSKVACTHTFDIANAREEFISLPLTFNIFSDTSREEGSLQGVFEFETDTTPEKIAEIIVPNFDGTITRNLDVKVTNPLDKATGTAVAIKPIVVFNEPIRGLATATLQKLGAELIETTADYKSTISGVGQTGSTPTLLIHEGDAFPANSFVGAKVRITYSGSVEAKETRTVTAYDPASKKLTLSAGAISSTLLGQKYEILVGYVKLTPKANLESTTEYELLIAGFIDNNGNKMATGGRSYRFTTA